MGGNIPQTHPFQWNEKRNACFEYKRSGFQNRENFFKATIQNILNLLFMLYISMLTCSAKDLRREVFGTDIIAAESIVYAFIHLGHLEEVSAQGVSGCKYKEKIII